MKIKLAGAGAVRPGIAGEIKVEYDAFLEAGRNMAEHAYRLGQMLTEVKDSLQHGEWLPWLNKNVDFSHDKATRFMGWYEHVGPNYAHVRNLESDAYSKWWAQRRIPRVTLKPLPARFPVEENETEEVVVEEVETVRRGRKAKPPTFAQQVEYWRPQLGIMEDSVADALRWGRDWTAEERREMWTRIIKPMIRELNKLSKWGED